MTLVMVVEDDEELRETYGISLVGSNMYVDYVERGDEVLDAVRATPPDVILLDVMLPGLDGIEVCKQIREESMVPIIMVTAKDSQDDELRGLQAGADDYIRKSELSHSVLIARIRAVLRRTAQIQSGKLQVGDIVIDQKAHTIHRGQTQVQLTRMEFELLLALARDPGRVFTREALLQEVWGYRHATDTRLVNVHIQRLRSKIELDPENPEIVTTVRGVGYKAGSSGVWNK